LINKRNNDLKHHSENLEKLIEERTSELESQIVKNINASRLVAVGEIASDIALEINNPLMVINGQVLKIKRQLTHVDREYRESIELPLEKISLMSERIVKIINGLKLISRDGHADVMIEFSLPKMVDEIKILTEMKIKSQDIKFTISMAENVGIIHGREVQISQVLVNLINNAVDAVSSLDNKWITLEVSDLDDVIKFAVSDCGNGISTELQKKIMNPFFTTKEVGKGTGLGLSISKGIVKEHGGDFYYNDKVINTQFVFTIRKKSNQLNVA
jgi:C4-dicarboxylate-specific signal transduction histidine kinase